MKPSIDSTEFGTITIENRRIHHDVYISLDGVVEKRRKILSKNINGTSHLLSLEEAKHIFQMEVNEVIIGSGQYGKLRLSEEATDYFDEKKCKVKLMPTPEAIAYWNRYEGYATGLFHVTC